MAINFNDLLAQGPITFDQFMAATPEERRAYIIQGNAAQYGYTPEYGYAANLRNVSGANGQALTPEQYQQILQNSGIDPTQAQSIGNNLGVILDNQQKALDDTAFWRQGILAGAGALGGAFLGASALGAGGSAAGGATAAGGASDLAALEAGGEGINPFLAGSSTGAEFGGGAGLDSVLAGYSGTGAAGSTLAGTATGAAGAAAGGSSLSRILNGTGTAADFASVLGAAAPGVIGAYAANQQAGALQDIANQTRADRAPYLAASQNYLANPDAYFSGPGKTALDANLRALSAKFGNPIDSPTALGIATQAGLQDWRNAVTSFGSLGLGGQGIQADLGAQSVGAQSNVYNALGGAAADVLNPPTTLDQLLKKYASSGSGYKFSLG